MLLTCRSVPCCCASWCLLLGGTPGSANQTAADLCCPSPSVTCALLVLECVPPSGVLRMWFCASAECAAVLTLDPNQFVHVGVHVCYCLCALLCRCTCINWQRLRVWPCCLLLSFALSTPRRAAALSCLETRYFLQSVPNWFQR